MRTSNLPGKLQAALMTLFCITLVAASPAAAQSIVVVTAPQADSDILPVAYAELKAGENRAAVEKLEARCNG